jgi:hypothetical protein
MLLRLGVMLAAVPLLVACAGGSDVEPTSSPDSSSSAAALTMTEVCPEVEAALPGGMLPSRGQLSRFRATLGQLAAKSDLETQNAIEVLTAGADAMSKAYGLHDGDPSAMVDGSRAWDAGISQFADRCGAVGSSALQG